jgi:hypothetical protein
VPRDSSITPADLVGELDWLNVSCENCGARDAVTSPGLVERLGADAKLTDRLDKITADCPRRESRSTGMGVARVGPPADPGRSLGSGRGRSRSLGDWVGCFVYLGRGMLRVAAQGSPWIRHSAPPVSPHRSRVKSAPARRADSRRRHLGVTDYPTRDDFLSQCGNRLAKVDSWNGATCDSDFKSPALERRPLTGGLY